MEKPICLEPIGEVRRRGDRTEIVIRKDLADGLLGLEGFSHIQVLYWLDRNDSPEARRTLRVHPRGDQANPLTGVFATHSPLRPNLIAVSLCRVLAVAGRRIAIEKIDALDGSPVLDLKCYIPNDLESAQVLVPDWV